LIIDSPMSGNYPGIYGFEDDAVGASGTDISSVNNNDDGTLEL